MKILIADDDPMNRKLLRAILEGDGHIVVEAVGGVEALAALQHDTADAIISDILMPRMDGYRLCYEVRKSDRLRDTPFIIYTATYTSPADEKLSRDLGSDCFLRKPASHADLTAALAEAAASGPHHTDITLTETDVLKEYSEQLITKLEAKNAALVERTDELTSSQARLLLTETAIHVAANAIIITDAAGVILFANPAFTALTGYSEAEAIGKSPNILRSGHHDDAFYREFWRTISSGETWRGEFTNRRKDGTIYYDEHTITPVRSPEGKIVNYVGIMHDVTARKQAENDLRYMHDQFRHLLAYSPAVLYRLKIEGETILPVTISDNITRLLGFETEEALSYEWWLGQLHPQDQDLALASINETIANGESSTDYRLRHKNGGYAWVTDNRRLVRDADGRPAEFVGVWVDITRRKQIEEALRHSEDRFREMLENVDLIAMTLDLNGRITFCNDHLLSITEWEREEVLGRDWFEIYIPVEQRSTMHEIFYRIHEGKMPSHYENSILTHSGEIRDIAWSNTQLRDAAGVIVGVASIGEDITERKQAEQSLRRSHQDLEQRVIERTGELEASNRDLQLAKEDADAANRAKSDFLSRMSHELRTPLNSILGFGQLLELEDLNARSREGVDFILSAGRHLLGLINEVLDIERLESGNLSVSRESVGVLEIVRESINMVRTTAEERGVAIMVNQRDFESKYVLADRQRFKQILLNLLSNAIKYSRGENPRIDVWCENGDGSTLAIHVTDNGRGISQEHMSRIFTPFDRLGAEATEIEGTGLGLALSKALVEAMGGRILVQSTIGVGSVFTVELPNTRPLEPVSKIDLGPEDNAPDARPARTIVYVEDSPPSIALVSAIFERRPSVTLKTATRGDEGLLLIRMHKPDLVLLDANLPGMSGRQVLTWLKREPETADIPVVIFSADLDQRNIQAMLDGGAVAFLSKPIVVSDFLRVVEEALYPSQDS